VTDQSSWVHLGSASTQGTSASASYTVDANPLQKVRSATVQLSVIGATQSAYTAIVINQSASGQTVTAACTLTVYPDSVTQGATSSQGTVQVSANSSTCNWTAQPSDAWVQVTSNSDGQGSGSVSYTVTPNPLAAARSATINVNDAVVQIQQAAGATNTCSVTLGATTANAGAAGGNATVQVIASDPGCSWSATADQPWITFPSGAGGSGSQTLTYAVAANPTQAIRTGNITVGSSTLTVTQAAAPAVVCTATLSPSTATVPAAGGSGSFNVTIAAGCSWTATPDSSWITISGGGSGSGNGTISYQVQPNSGGAQTGHIAVADQQFTITQPAGQAQATLSASPNPITACNAAGLGSTALTWNAPSAAAISISANSPAGTAIGSGGPSGSIQTGYTVSDGTVFFLLDGSGNTLAQTTVSVACALPLGAIPSGELTELNAADWQFQATAVGAASDVAGFDETNTFQVGTASVGVGTNNGDTVIATYPNPAAKTVLWDLSGSAGITLWLSADTGSAGFATGSPVIRLSSANGQLTIVPATAVLNDAVAGWLKLSIPLTSANGWTASSSNNFDITHVTSVQVTFKSASPGMTVLMDGLHF
jgi:hypothetical protein